MVAKPQHSPQDLSVQRTGCRGLGHVGNNNCLHVQEACGAAVRTLGSGIAFTRRVERVLLPKYSMCMQQYLVYAIVRSGITILVHTVVGGLWNVVYTQGCGLGLV